MQGGTVYDIARFDPARFDEGGATDEPPVARTLEQRLAEGVVIGAEGYVFELERRGYIKAGPYVPEVILDEPDAVRQLHREFLRAGSDVMVALTYYAHRDKLKDVGRDGELEAMNRQAVRIANEVAAEGDALVAGNICNTWSYDPSDPERVRRGRPRAVRGAARLGGRGGHRLRDRRDLRLRRRGADRRSTCARQLGLPAMVTFASVQPATTYDGYDYVEACRILADAGAAIVGLNCSRGPETMLPLLEESARRSTSRVAAQPVPYRTSPADARVRVAALRRRRAPVPDPARAVPVHALRDGGVRAPRARHRRGLHRHLLRRRAAPRARDGRGARRETPASRYSPAIELHPVLGDAGASTSSWAAGTRARPSRRSAAESQRATPRRAGQGGVQVDVRAVRFAGHLDDVAELVGQPEAASGEEAPVRRQVADERVCQARPGVPDMAGHQSESCSR